MLAFLRRVVILGSKRLAVEARHRAGVTGDAGSLRLDGVDDCVSIAVDHNGEHFHKVAALLALDPALSAGSREETDIAGLQRLQPAGLVCEGDHEDLARVCMLHDGYSKIWKLADSPLEVRLKYFH